MPIAPRTLAADEPFFDIEEDIEVILLALLACKLTLSLAPEIEQLLTDMEPLRATQTTLERAVAAEEAKIPFADDDLNNVLDDAKKAVPAQLSAEEAAKILGRLFKEYNATELRRFTLSEQLRVQRGWEDILKPTNNAALMALGTRSTAATAYADEVVGNQSKAQTALDQFMLGPRTAFVAECNKRRGAVFGKILEIANEPANAPLPSEFVDRFFLRDTSGRVMRLADLDKAITRLETRLGRLKERREDLKKKQDGAARSKLQAKVDAKKAKLDAKQKGMAEEAAEIAAMEAELAKNPDA